MEDTYAYKGWLNSDFFWKRVGAFIGYGIVVAIIYYLVLFLLLLGLSYL